MRPPARSTRSGRKRTSKPRELKPSADEDVHAASPNLSEGMHPRDSEVQLATDDSTVNSARKARHRMTTEQLLLLEALFKCDTHPARKKKKEVAEELKMSLKSVTIWFQNKRQMAKKSDPASTSASSEQSDNPSASIGSPLQDPQYPFVPEVALRRSPTQGIEGDQRHIALLETMPKDNNDQHFPKKRLSIQIKPLVHKIETRPVLKASTAVEIPKQELWKLLPSSPTTIADGSCHSSSATCNSDNPMSVVHKHEDEDGKLNTILEWACERQIKKRRRAIRENHSCRGDKREICGSGETPLGTGTQDISFAGDRPSVPWKESPTHSALSLLSLATLAREFPHPPTSDVLHGASLLLYFKHSMRRSKRHRT